MPQMTPRLAYYYARDTIKGPTPQNEHIIATDSYHSYKYALNILRTRFHEGEYIIARNPYWACSYAKNILKNRFPTAEQYIIEDGPQRTNQYLAIIIPHTHINYHIYHIYHK